MTFAAFDTLKAVETLREAGIEEAHAKAIVNTMRDAVAEGAATKTDLRTAVADFRASLRTAVADLKAAMLKAAIGVVVAVVLANVGLALAVARLLDNP